MSQIVTDYYRFLHNVTHCHILSHVTCDIGTAQVRSSVTSSSVNPNANIAHRQLNDIDVACGTDQRQLSVDAPKYGMTRVCIVTDFYRLSQTLIDCHIMSHNFTCDCDIFT